MHTHQPPVDDNDWKEVINRLHAFAEDQIGLYIWFRGAKALPKGFKAEDFVQETILYYLEHRDDYDPARGPFLRYLKYGICRRMVYNLSDLKENEKGKDIFRNDCPDSDGVFTYEHYLPVELLTIDCQLDFEKVVNVVIDQIDGDHVVEQIFEGLFINNLKRSEICEHYQINENDYANGVRRLATKMKTSMLLLN